MRLTLRTMLAYLDDILEPQDAQDLGKKIEESEFASGLVHRIRSAMRRLRLEAPKIEGKGMGLDPNTVAEYLDNTLPQDRVPDVEKICLESDVHLAEVASCHQILTIVLGEPAEVDGAVRQRIYRLAQTGREPATAGNGAAQTASPPPAEVGKPAPPAAGQPRQETAQSTAQSAAPAAKQRDVPEYLRGQSGVRLAPLAITLALAFVLAAAGLAAFGGLSRDGFVWRIFGGSSEPSIAQSNDGDAAPAPVVDESKTTDQQPAPAVDEASAASVDQGQAPAEPGDGAAPSPPADTGVDAADSTAKPDASETPPDAASTEKTVADAKPPGDEPRPADARPPIPPQPGSEPPAVQPGAEAPATAAAAIGRYISEREVLAKFDVVEKTWLRLPPRAPLSSGDMLLAAPAYRPQILLATAIQIMADGPTSLQFHDGDSADVVRLAIEFGRASIVTVGKAGAQLELVFGGRRGVATFGDADSAMAVQVRRFLPPGADPENTAPQVAVEIFATSGRIEWRDGAAAPVQINSGQVYRFLDEMPAQLNDAAAMPKWIHLSETTIEDLAARDLEQFLTTDRSLRLSLAEKLDYRKNEVRSLAARTLAYLDDFEPVIQQLEDDQQYSFWRSGLDSLHECMCRSPATAAQVRGAFEKMHGDEAAELYRLVWGYDRAQFESGAAERLVDLLDHPELQYRVLAFENLHQITGATHGYAANYIESRRKRFLRIWRDRLAEGMVTYKWAPAPFDSGPPPTDAP